MATIEPSLYLPTRRDSLIVGYTEEDSRALLEQLWATVNDAPCVVGVALLPGDFIIWDNVACAHSREGWPADQGRLVWHVSAEGEIPTPRYSKKVVNTIGMDRTAALEANKATYVSAI